MKYILFVFVLIFTGCATKGEKKCLDTDWYDVGLADAISGEATLQHDKYANECKEFKVSINKAGYVKGYEDGLDQYCTYKNGYQRGKDNLESHPFCKNINSLFENAYLEAKRKFHK